LTIGVYTLELHLPMARSLKDKRQVVKRLKDRVRSRHNVAVAELPQYSDLWQRAELVFVSVAGHRDALERLFESIHREAESQVPGNVNESGPEFIDASEAEAPDWSEDPA